MIFMDTIQTIITAAADQFISWVCHMLPQIFLFLIFMNAVTHLIGRTRVERLAVLCGSNSLLRYMLLPFLSAVILGNPMAVSMGRYLPEQYKPAYFASVSYHCHTNSGIFQHINPSELFLWIGIADGILSLRLKIFPLALRYMCAGLIANYISGYVTEIITLREAKKRRIKLSAAVDLREGGESLRQTDRDIAAIYSSTQDSRDFSHERNVQNADENECSPALSEKKQKVQQTDSEAKSRFRSITITRGDGGYGGPVTVTPTEDRHVVLYMTGGGIRPEPLDKIIELSGMRAVNGNLEVCPDEKVALAVIDCAGTLRCGIYPGKGIPTVNILPTGRSGPLAKYMTEDLYVSAVTSAEIVPSYSELSSEDTAGTKDAAADFTADAASRLYSGARYKKDRAPGTPLSERMQHLLNPVAYVSRVINAFYQAARDAVSTCQNMIIPFMGFAALFIGICRGSGLTEFLAGLIEPMEGSLPGLFLIGILCSVPGLSAILSAGAVAAQMFAAVVGDLIMSGSIAPALALPALFAINCQCACDFIPVGLGMMEARAETVQLGTSAVTLSRFVTGWLRVLIALIFSIGLYA